MNQFVLPKQFIPDENGKPIVGAKAYFYKTGTLQYLTVYRDALFATAHDPENITSDARGEFPPIFIKDETYKCEVRDANDVVISGPHDNLTGQVDLTDIVSSKELYNTPVREIQTNYTASINDAQKNAFLNSKPISDNITIELPSAAEVGNGYGLTVRSAYSSEYKITVVPKPASSETIDEAEFIDITTFNEQVRFTSDGANWIAAKYIVPKDTITIEQLDPRLKGSMMQVGYPVMWFGKPEKAPAGLLPADGQLVNIADYQDLYDAYGVMYGGDGVTTFGMPDLRGYTIRGMDDGAGRDPDAANRTARPDGVGGDNIGTTQGDEIKGHTHTGTTDENGEHRHEFPSGAAGVAVAAGNIGVYNVKVSGETGDAGKHTHTFTTNATGGLETRGKNIYAKIYIVAAPELTAGASGALTKIHTVNGLPPNTLGIDGDFAIDPTIARLYGPKSNGTWSSLTELQGSAGEDGNTILSGNNAPLNSLGVNGDFYFDLNNKDFYGPKSGNEWFAPISLTGDKGDKGEAFLIDAIDIVANRSNYDSESDGFIFYASDTQVAYHKEGSDPSGWLGPISLGGSVTSLNQNTFAGRVSSGNGTIEELSPVVARQILNIEDGATADQTGAEIKALYEAEANTNALTDPLLNKLNSIDASHYGAPIQSTTDLAALSESAISDKERRYVEDELSDYFYDSSALSGDIAPTDQTGGSGFWKKVAVGGESAASIKTKYESNADTNAFTDALASKVNGIEVNATADQTDSEIETAYNNVVSVVSSSEITLGTEASVRRFSPANIKSMIDTHSSGSSTSSADLLMMQLRLADLEGDAAILNDGIIDPFDDETDVDTVNSANQVYVPSDGKYGGASDGILIATTFGSNIGDMTGGNGINAAFDGNTITDVTASSYQGSAGTTFGYVGKNATSSPKAVEKVTCYGAASFGFAGGASVPNVTIDLYGKNGSAPTGPTDGTLLGSSGPFADSNGAVVTVNSSDTSTTWDYFWVAITPAADFAFIAEAMFYEPSVPANMTIQSNSFMAGTAPDLARVFVQIETNENITLNTDLIVSASRDGGSNWVAGVLVDTGLSVNGVKLYDANGIDLSGQASSADMKWKIETLNNKLMSIHGIGFKWS
ncbi:MAG: tail fiber protein [Rhizobiales bacterium]|nr:tail fiber protein [Hyphomicrobiales bacterium]